MNKILLLSVILTLQAAFCGLVQAQTWSWAKRAGANFEEQSRCVGIDANGNSYVAGFFVDQTNFGSGLITAYGGSGADIFIAKYNPSGTLLWMQRAGSDQDDFAYDIAVTSSGDVFVSGRFQDTASFGAHTLISNGAYDVFVAKYNTMGVAQWVQGYGGIFSELGYSIALDPSGNIFIGGSFQNSAVFGTTTLTAAGGSDAFVAKLSSTGAVLWAKQAGGPLNDLVYRVASDAAGNCLVTGSFWGTATFGSLSLSSSGNADMFVAKYSAAGTEQWAKKGGSTMEDNGYGITTDNLGNVYVTGYFRGTATFEATSFTSTGNYEIFLLKYTAAGALEWAQQAGGTGYDNGWSVDTDNDNNIYLTGYFQNTATFGSLTVTAVGDRDIFVAKYNPSGVAQWARSGGGNMFDNAYSLATDAAGNSFVTGFIYSAATFGTVTITPAGSYDMFVARIINCPTIALTAGPDVSVCTGQPVTLGGPPQAGVTYSWSVSPAIAGFSSNQSAVTVPMPSVSGTIPYTFTVSATSQAGCVVTDQAVVTVNTPPNVSVSSSQLTICPGGTTHLTASGAASYSWQPATGLSATTGNIVSANPAITTIYTVSGTNAGCAPDPEPVTVTVTAPPAAPAATAGPACMGNNLALTASSIAGATYSWSGPAGFSASGQNPEVLNLTAASSGVYSVVAIGSAPGCVSEAGTVSVSVAAVPAATQASNNGPVCAGSALQLSAASVANAQYTWSGPGNYFSAVQNPVIQNTAMAMAGNYSVTVTVNGCTSAAAVTNAVINFTPAFSVLTSNTPVCTGSDIYLSADAGPGVTYSWVGPDSFFSSDQNPIITNPDSSQTGTYSVFAASGGCVSASGNIFVAVIATPSVPVPSVNSPVCEGDTLKLGVDYVPGASYSWTGPGGFASLLADPLISGVSASDAGIYTVYSLGAGCIPESDTISVQVIPSPPAPVAVTNSPVCEGSPLQFSATGVPGAIYSWVGPDNFSASAQHVQIPSPDSAATGFYYVYAIAGGCTSPAGIVLGQVNPLPVVTVSATADTINGAGNTQLLAAATGNGPYSYSWYPAAGLSDATVANPVAEPAGSVTYSVRVTDINTGCSADAGISIIVLSSGPDLLTESVSLRAMPNPFSGEFTAEFTLEGSQEVILTLSDLLGRVIASKKVTGSKGRNLVHYNLTGKCSEGLYLLTLQAGQNVRYEKVIKAGN